MVGKSLLVPGTRSAGVPAIGFKIWISGRELIFWEEGKEERELLLQLRPDAILTKESGRSGYFREKVEAARKSGIPVVVIKRPVLPRDSMS